MPIVPKSEGLKPLKLYWNCFTFTSYIYCPFRKTTGTSDLYLMLLVSGNVEGHNFLTGVERNLLGHLYRKITWYFKNKDHVDPVYYFTERTVCMVVWFSHYICRNFSLCNHIYICGPGSVVGIATAYGLDGPGIESRWGEIFRTSPDRPRGPPSLLYNEYRVLPGVRCGRDVTLIPHSLLVQRSKIE